MTRIMLNMTGPNVTFVRVHEPVPPLVGMYETGTSDVDWDATDKAQYPTSILVTIDQAGPGSPNPNAVVRDVENGAWSVDTAVNDRPWNVGRRTIYCSRDTLPALQAAGWKGDVWLADPNYSLDTPPDISPMHCVAVQNEFYPQFESSIVYDDAWPYLLEPEENMQSYTVTPTLTDAIAFPAGTFGHVAILVPSATTHEECGVALSRHSVSKGWTEHNENVHQDTPLVIPMDNPDVDAVITRNMSTDHVVYISLY